MASKADKSSHQSIINDIRAKKFSPIYTLQGDETFFIERIIDCIENEILSDSEKSFNQTILYGKETDMTTLLSQARRFPMMSEYQVVILKEAQSMADLGKEAGQVEFSKYLDNPVPSTILVICYMGKKMDGRSAFTKKLGKSGVLFTSEKIRDYLVQGWIENFVKGQKLSITPKASIMMAEFIGNNLERIYNELNKILLNMPTGQTTINEQMVEEFVGISKDYNFFELQSAIMVKNHEKIFRILNYFDANEKNVPPIMLVGLFTSFLSKLLVLSLLPNAAEGTLTSAFPGLWKNQMQEYVSAKRYYGYYHVAKGIQLLNDADLQLKGIKGGSAKPTQIIREFVIRFIQ